MSVRLSLCIGLVLATCGCAPASLIAPYVTINDSEKGGTINSIHGYPPETIRDALEKHCSKYGRVALVKYRDNFNDSLIYECL